MQVPSELGYGGAAPVLEHVQVSLALKLPTHNHKTQREIRSVHAVTTAPHLALNRQATPPLYMENLLFPLVFSKHIFGAGPAFVPGGRKRTPVA